MCYSNTPNYTFVRKPRFKLNNSLTPSLGVFSVRGGFDPTETPSERTPQVSILTDSLGLLTIGLSMLQLNLHARGRRLRLKCGDIEFIWRNPVAIPDLIEVQSKIMIDFISDRTMDDNAVSPSYRKEELKVARWTCNDEGCWVSEPSSEGVCYLYCDRKKFAYFANTISAVRGLL